MSTRKNLIRSNTHKVRYEMSSMSNENVSSEIVMNDLHLGDNPYMQNSEEDSTYFPLNSEMVESCDANEDLFQYMRHRSLVLEIWIALENIQLSLQSSTKDFLLGGY